MTALLQLASLSLEFNERVALKAVDLTARAGKPVARVGPNGQHPEADAQIVDGSGAAGSGAGRVRRGRVAEDLDGIDESARSTAARRNPSWTTGAGRPVSPASGP
ncbi:hypothetical protein GCM10010331_54040 [Streptomyces xanthochromogenes]|uniref:hypothetical protein n=1 Tax=Streptomyces xanthochromogenes TaxID=67384 RepID=UPI00167894DB|nr:hypothetical protein [Streptomyces xanthochromogenes]GHB59316.1 hypothetical protein GCM10010331_54040 [Streptomyces xanthochromogenes]